MHYTLYAWIVVTLRTLGSDTLQASLLLDLFYNSLLLMYLFLGATLHCCYVHVRTSLISKRRGVMHLLFEKLGGHSPPPAHLLQRHCSTHCSSTGMFFSRDLIKNALFQSSLLDVSAYYCSMESTSGLHHHWRVKRERCLMNKPSMRSFAYDWKM